MKRNLWDCLKCSNNWEDCKCIYHCRFHPTDWFHEVGCQHQEWTDKEKLHAEEVRGSFGFP